MRRIAFFGGSFDPPHRGHLAIARAAADRFALDQVLFAPVGRQPLKAGRPMSAFPHRYAMTALATQSDARFVPSMLDAPLEDGLARPNYTVETLERLREALSPLEGPTTLFCLVGADSWLDIARWHRAAELLALCDWIVASRPGFSLVNAGQCLPPEVTATEDADLSLMLTQRDGTATRAWFLPELQEDVAGTDLRSSLDAEHTAAAEILSEVEDYIRKVGLYGAGVCGLS
ncbi:MAG: nicotinate (nicotinamide) nucleotide adenylyltransferase [Acidobacteriaceae bacterium]